jgi:hypothetical protein
MAVFDENKRYLGEMLSIGPMPFTGRRPVTERDWIYLPSHAYVGGRVTLQPVAWRRDPDGKWVRALNTPGKYFFQLILYKAFLSGPASLGESWYDEGELFRSNAVEIDIVAPPTSQPSP